MRYLFSEGSFFRKVLILMLLGGVVLPNLLVKGQGYDCPEMLFPKYNKKNRLYGFATLEGDWKIDANYVQVTPFDGAFAAVQINKLWGVINCSGISVVAATYEEVGPITYGKFFGKINGVWAFNDASGRVRTNETFEDFREIRDRGLICWVKKNGKWGLFDKEVARIILAPKYETITPLSDSVSIIRSEGRFGVFNHYNRKIKPDSIDFVKPVTRIHNAILKNGKWGVINSFGRVILKLKFDSISSSGGFLYAYESGKVSLYNALGNTIVKEAINISKLTEKVFVEHTEKTTFKLRDASGKLLPVGPFTYASTPENGLLLAAEKNIYGIYDLQKQNWTIPPFGKSGYKSQWGNIYGIRTDAGYKLIRPRSAGGMTTNVFDTLYLNDSLPIVRVKEKGIWGILNVSDNQFQRLKDTLDDLKAPQYGTFIGRKQSKAGLLGKSGSWIIPLEYDSLQYVKDTKAITIRVWKKGLCGLFNLEGNPLLAVEFQELIPSINRTYKCKKKDKWGIVYPNGSYLIEPEYESMSHANNSPEGQPEQPVVVQKKGQKFLIDPIKNLPIGALKAQSIDYKGANTYFYSNGKEQGLLNIRGINTPIESVDSLGIFVEGLAPAKQNGKWGFINQQGKWQIPAKYDRVLPYKGRNAFAFLGNKWGSIDRSNNTISAFIFDELVQTEGILRLVKRD